MHLANDEIINEMKVKSMAPELSRLNLKKFE